MGMGKILLTGSSGVVGTYVLFYLLEKGYKVIAIDKDLPNSKILEKLKIFIKNDKLIIEKINLTNIENVKKLFLKYYSSSIENEENEEKLKGLIHLAAIPDPLKLDSRLIHNLNVIISYNVLYTAAEIGIKKIVQASSVNFTGLAYTRKGKQWFGFLPITENEIGHAEDPYALSKWICEAQATTICRLFEDVRITSLRFHHILPTLKEAEQWSKPNEFWAWTSSLSASQACLLGLTSKGWKGHESFNIVAPEIAKPISISSDEIPIQGSLELFKDKWEGKEGTIGEIRKDWWEGEENKYRGFWDCTKAETLLGWKHNV
ncbi:uncharacterized protein I206_103204 [Kwoniella pini CBS 10737]|uniref:NAD-dependent epimerase/dehydratase domain-containing protein n=1 Tax=Kwoniella pini CBS 10737 TaxID=1296096 RepID=A0A1B9IAQ9_9TREE|nr:uncharacterized protein I206_01791 [Kwoniella pini CBS 10737]OCF52501.1 hypothetical protein I206_01791 [Kwoniella pini CBS 10737]